MFSLKNRLVRWGLSGVFLAAALGAAAAFGAYLQSTGASSVGKFLVRVDTKLDEWRGAPRPIERDLATVETTFLQLKGRVLRPPVKEWRSGGALAVRGDRLIVMNRLGQLFATDGASDLRALDRITLPDSGRAAYLAAIETPKYADFHHKPFSFRYNDLLWAESGQQSGFAVSYTFYDPARECYGTRVAWAAAEAGAALETLQISASDWSVLFETRPCLPLNPTWTAIDGLMAGGRMAFEAPSTLYLGSGDYHLDGIHTYDVGLQSDQTSYGKVIAIDLADGSDRIVSKGHRNPQGVALDRQGRLWVTDHGVRGGDELNLVRDGANFGWPNETLGTLYNAQPIPGLPYALHQEFDAPAFAWLPSPGLSSLTALDGVDPAWDGDLIAGSLSSAGVGRSLWHIRTRGARVVFAERIPLGHRIRYVTQFRNQLAVWFDTNDLAIFDLVRPPDPLAEAMAWLTSTAAPTLVDDLRLVLTACNECHSFAKGDHRAGPSLNAVAGREIASTTFDGYSGALESVAGTWDRERLKAYLKDPSDFAPGTTMPAQGLRDGPVLEALLDVLERVGDGPERPEAYDN